MRTGLASWAVLPAALLLLSPSLSASETAAASLVRDVREARAVESAVVRARLVVTDTARPGARGAVHQLRVRARRDGGTTRCLYQVIWPAAEKGTALCFEREEDGAMSGFVFVPPEAVTPLAGETMSEPYLGSDLSIEDLVTDYWLWPGQAIVGEEMVGDENCTIVESRPPEGALSGYASVRSWVSLEKKLPLRIDKLDAAGALVKRFTFRKFARRDGKWSPTITVVQRPEKSQETRIEISRGDREAEVPPEVFTLEAIKRFVGGERTDE